ncbi:PAS domain-containing protein [Egibacter rhizosphaerae]|uniref:histidine kinase n=1 Tax=Egibacter rhizosphaerae TaxID=1670831 RepID=A0A411YJ85_9ACTN|nr:ATP-binding protein [Egibacter rhizosphaerae]QBI21273.1 PAS domain-containing protein [Egibacter rhizosphaerae]
MTGIREALRELPRSAQRLIWLVTAAAVALCAAAIALAPAAMSPVPVVAIAASMVLGERFGLDIDSRNDNTIRFALADTAVFAALAFTAPGNVALGALLGILIAQLLERTEPIKVLFNCAQYTVCASLAAITLFSIADDPLRLDSRTVLGFALAVALFIVANSVLIALITGFVTQRNPLRLAQQLAPTSALVPACNGAFAVLVLVLWVNAPFALAAMAAPLILLHLASRAQTSEQRLRNRSDLLVEVERNLAEARDPVEVSRLISEGVRTTLGLSAALWHDGRWRAGAPEGSGSCPVDGEADPQRGTLADFGLLGEERALAVPFGPGVLVAWGEGAATADELLPWLERFARSARVHLDRAAASMALEQERATLEAVVGGTADGILVLDDDGIVRLWNDAMASLTGTTDGRHQQVHDVLGPGPWQDPGVHDVIRPNTNTDDGRIWRVAIASVDDAGLGRLSVAVVHDVTEERRVAQAKDDMLAIVSHELRTPLTPIKASAQLLSQRADRLDQHQRQRLLDQIENRADHLGRLVEDLILVAQLSSQGSDPPRVVPATADLVQVVRGEVDRAQESLPEHVVAYEGPESLLGTTDALRLQQVLANLLDNAGKFSPTGGTISVHVIERDEHVEIRVIDEGPGVPLEDRDRVFERFERLEDPLRMRTSGAGLGLFIVRALVRALGGEVTIDDGPTAGTAATVQLPLLGVTTGPVVVEPPPRIARRSEQHDRR